MTHSLDTPVAIALILIVVVVLLIPVQRWILQRERQAEDADLQDRRLGER